MQQQLTDEKSLANTTIATVFLTNVVPITGHQSHALLRVPCGGMRNLRLYPLYLQCYDTQHKNLDYFFCCSISKNADDCSGRAVKGVHVNAYGDEFSTLVEI